MMPTAPTVELQREPFRLFFPLAAALGACGVLPWILYATGATDHYLSRYHAVTQTQSCLIAFAAGFLLTAIPKRTQSKPAGWVEIAALLVLAPATSLATLLDVEPLGQAAYATSLLVLAQFAVRRFLSRTSGRRPPASFAMVPCGLLVGLAGAALSAAGLLGAASPAALGVGRRLVFEGVFICLSLGIGAFFLPLAGRGEAAPDLGKGRWISAPLYALAGLGLAASLVLEATRLPRLGPLLGGVIAVLVLILSGAWRPPSRSGANRRLVWAAPWAIPVGLLGIAAFPDYRVEALHVMLIGGFGMLAFSVATHVSLGHSGREALQSGYPWPVLGFGALFLGAMALRVGAVFVPAHYFGWLGVAAVLWIAGALLWAAFILPKIWRPPVAAEVPAAAPS